MEPILVSVIITVLIFSSLLAASRFASSNPSEPERLRRMRYSRSVGIDREEEESEPSDSESEESSSKIRELLTKAKKG